MNRNQDQIKVYRTTEGTIFEVATVILAIIVWGLIIWFVNQAPDIIPVRSTPPRKCRSVPVISMPSPSR